MSADVVTEPLSKVDSAISDEPASPNEKKISHRRTSSAVSGVFNINDLGRWRRCVQIAVLVTNLAHREGEDRASHCAGDTEAGLVSLGPNCPVEHIAFITLKLLLVFSPHINAPHVETGE